MTDLYHLSKAVYSGDLSTAQAVLDKMRAKDFSVLRGRMAAGIALSSEALPVNIEVQARLDALMAKEEAQMDVRAKLRRGLNKKYR